MLRLLRSDANRAWSVAGLSLELRSNESAILKRLDDLYRSQVLLPPGAQERLLKYSPATEEIDAKIVELLGWYSSHPHRVFEAIYALRPSALKAFADAFKLRKDE